MSYREIRPPLPPRIPLAGRRMCASLGLALLMAAPLHAQQDMQPGGWRAAVQGTEVRAAPDAAQPAVGRLAAGQQVQVLQASADGRWLRVAREDGTVLGYVPLQALAAAQAPPAPAQEAAAAGGGSLFARSLGVQGVQGVQGAPVPAPAEGSLFGGSVLRGDVDAAHAQRREQERVAALQREQEAQARREAEARRQREDEQQRLAEEDRRQRQQRQWERERAVADAEADRARQRQWAQTQASVARITQDVQRQTEPARRALEEHQRQQAQRQRTHEEAQVRAREQAQADARAQEQRAQEARVQAQAQARQQAAAAPSSVAGVGQSAARAPVFGAVAAAAQAGSVPAAQAGGVAASAPRADVPASGSSGAGIRIAAVHHTPGQAGPGSGSMTKHGLRVGACTVDAIRVEWNLGVMVGEPTVGGTYTWEGVGDCQLPASTIVLLHVQAPGMASGWLRLAPVVPRPGERGYNVTGSPSLDALLCEFQDARQGSCLRTDSARAVWLDGRVSDFVVAW